MRPSRSRLTTRPDFGSSGRAAARGRRTSTPPCMIGAVIMKMMSSTNATSTSDVTLMSALSGSSPCPRRPPPPPSNPGILEPPFARHRPDDLLSEPLEFRRRERALGQYGGAVLLQAARLELREEVNPFAQQAVIGGGR